MDSCHDNDAVCAQDTTSSPFCFYIHLISISRSMALPSLRTASPYKYPTHIPSERGERVPKRKKDECKSRFYTLHSIDTRFR